MPDRQTAMLRVEPHMLSALINAYQQTMDELRPLLNNLNGRGRVGQAWTEDPVTEKIQERYNAYAVDGDQSAYAMLRLYETELRNVLDTLTRMDADYRRTDEDVAALMDKR